MNEWRSPQVPSITHTTYRWCRIGLLYSNQLFIWAKSWAYVNYSIFHIPRHALLQTRSSYMSYASTIYQLYLLRLNLVCINSTRNTSSFWYGIVWTNPIHRCNITFCNKAILHCTLLELISTYVAVHHCKSADS